MKRGKPRLTSRSHLVRFRVYAAVLFAAMPAGSQAQLAPDAPPPVQARDSFSSPGLFTVEVKDEVWRDDARNRDVPVRVYLPEPGGIAVAARPPVIIFSHGLGGSGQNYGYFGTQLAGHGYLVIAPTHAGSDTAALLKWLQDHPGDKATVGRGWLTDSINDPDNLRQRPKDISFVIDQLAKRDTVSTIADLSRIGVAGHSFGAYTSMAVGGMLVDLPDAPDTSFRDGRVKAVLPMSPQGRGTMGIDDRSWDRLAVPVLFLTGTKDYGAGGLAAAWRREAFDSIRGVDAYLATIEGGTHMTFSGQGGEQGDDARDGPRKRVRDRIREKIGAKGLSEPDPDEAAHLVTVRALATAFFDAYLKDDPDAKEWLRTYATTPHQDCTAEFRDAKEPTPSATR